MTSRTGILTIVVAVSCLLSSCLSSSSETTTTTYDDAAITAFSLGTIKHQRHVKTSRGTDSTYMTTYTGSKTPMHIDQVNNTIYNSDALPEGCVLNNLLVTITAKNSGSVVIKNLTEDGYTSYSTTDSVSFMDASGNIVPRVFRVRANDMNSYRDYTVTLKVATADRDSFTYESLGAQQALSSLYSIKAVAAEDTIYILGTERNAQNATLLSGVRGTGWQTVSGTPTLAADATMGMKDSTLYLLSGGTVYCREKGKWSQRATATNLKTMLGGTLTELFAINNDGTFSISRDGGQTWEVDNIENVQNVAAERMPVKDINTMTTYVMGDLETSRFTVIGNKEAASAADSTAMIWSRLVDPAHKQQTWVNVTYKAGKACVLPCLKNISATQYGGAYLFAIGGERLAGNVAKSAYDKIYCSSDYGVTWQSLTGLHFPSDFDRTKATQIVSDGKGYFYLISAEESGKVWRCCLNGVVEGTTQEYYDTLNSD